MSVSDGDGGLCVLFNIVSIITKSNSVYIDLWQLVCVHHISAFFSHT